MSDLTGWGQPEAEAIADGARLRDARKAAGLTQADLGRRCGVSGSLVGQMERAQYPITVTFRRSARTWVGDFEAPPEPAAPGPEPAGKGVELTMLDVLAAMKHLGGPDRLACLELALSFCRHADLGDAGCVGVLKAAGVTLP